MAEGRAKLCMMLLGQLDKTVFTGQSGDFTIADKVDTLQTAFKYQYMLYCMIIKIQSNGGVGGRSRRP